VPKSSKTLFGKAVRSAQTCSRGGSVPTAWKEHIATAKQNRHRSNSILKYNFELFEVMQGALLALWSLWADFMATRMNPRGVPEDFDGA
jgi:hypothetical protein